VVERDDEVACYVPPDSEGIEEVSVLEVPVRIKVAWSQLSTLVRLDSTIFAVTAFALAAGRVTPKGQELREVQLIA
jgi:NADH:ubiquinone oxidoreductase subunit D